MSKIVIFLITLASIHLSYKQDEVRDPEEDKVTFSYNNFKVPYAQASSGLSDADGRRTLSIVLQNATDFQGEAAIVDVEIANYNGPGSYPFGEHVRVSAKEEGMDEYWQHYYYHYSDKVYSTGTVTIEKLTDERIVAKIDGKLFHSTATDRKETTVKASINYWR